MTGIEAGSRGWEKRLVVIGWALLVVLNLVPVWGVGYLPSQDGPAHVNNANVLLKLSRSDGAFSKYYEINRDGPPNLLSHWIMVPLLWVASPATVVKLIASVYLVSFPLAFYYAARAVSGNARFTATLAVPLAAHLLFTKGFYNFCFSLSLFFVLVGYFLRHRRELNAFRAMALGAIALLLYLSHPVSLGMGCLTVGILAVTGFWQDRRILIGAVEAEGAGVARDRSPRRTLVLTFFALAPALILYSQFHLRSRRVGLVSFTSVVERFKFLGTLNVMHSFGVWPEKVAVWLLLLTIVFATVCAAYGALRSKGRPRHFGLLMVIGASLVVYWFAPDASSGGSYITLRLSLFPFMLTVLWLGAQPLHRGFYVGLPMAGLVCTALLAAGHLRVYRAFDPLLREFVRAGDRIPAGATLLPLIDQAHTPLAQWSPRVQMFHNAAGYLAAERQLIDLRNYEAALPDFPTRYRREMDPTNDLGKNPPDIQAYEHGSAHSSVDYILQCPAGALGALPEVSRGDYEKISVSPGGLVALYRRRGLR